MPRPPVYRGRGNNAAVRIVVLVQRKVQACHCDDVT